MPDITAATTGERIEQRTLYGVAHIDPGGAHVIQYRDRDDAERRLFDCQEDDADCYLVRAVVAWEKVPDDE